jgi:PAS domain S-box-containing protein
MAKSRDAERLEIAAELRRLRTRLDELERSERDLEVAYDALAESETRFRAVVDSSFDLVSEFDAKGILTWVSPKTGETVGWSPEELIGTFVLDKVHPDDFGVASSAVAVGMDSGRFEPVTYRYQHKDGRWLDFESTAARYRTRAGEMRILGVSRNITEQLRNLEERERAIEEKETALAHVRVLTGLLPICTHCRKVRDDAGYWRSLEAYVASHSTAVFSHSLCEPCLRQHYGHIFDDEG